MDKLKYRVDLDFIGISSAAKAYGGKLEAWSFIDVQGEAWLSNFRKHVLSCIGKKYLPIYRMADGEYRFLIGRKFNPNRRPLIKEIVAITAEKIKLKNPNRWKTSWGEEYSPEEIKGLRQNLLEDIRFISQSGYLACYINDNGLHAFTEYNKYMEFFFHKYDIRFDAMNYIPFHFVVGLLTNDGWQIFYKNRKILIISGIDDAKEAKIKQSLFNLGASNVEFLRISSTASMKDILDLSKVKTTPDLCLVAAGIGSANILRQLEPLQTVVLDIGGYMNCYIDKSLSIHGGIFGLPVLCL